jgi:hypothetical protein
MCAAVQAGLPSWTAGAGAVRVTRRADGLAGTPALLLLRLSRSDLETVTSATLPIGANPGAVQCVTVGGCLVYVTDGVGALLTIQP